MQLDLSDLASAFREESQKAFEQVLATTLPDVIRKATTPAYMTAAQIAAHTGLSKRQIQYLKKRGCIPFVQRGRAVRYPTADVLAYLEEGRVPARADRS